MLNHADRYQQINEPLSLENAAILLKMPAVLRAFVIENIDFKRDIPVIYCYPDLTPANNNYLPQSPTGLSNKKHKYTKFFDFDLLKSDTNTQPELATHHKRQRSNSVDNLRTALQETNSNQIKKARLESNEVATRRPIVIEILKSQLVSVKATPNKIVTRRNSVDNKQE